MNWEIPTIYLIIIGLEICLSNYHHRKLYSWRETVTTVLISLSNGLLDLCVRGGYMLVLLFIYRFRLTDPGSGLLYWFFLFILIDFQFYWLHRLEHFCRLFWAAHYTHHSAERMNISVGFRASVFRPLYDFLFFLPIAFIGFRPIDIMLMYSFAQIWAVFLHTEMIRSLGFLEYIFATPSHHRVHHASNEKYLDRNMGMVLIIWDRLFGTFQKELRPEEYEPIRYGLTKPLRDNRLSTVIFQEWSDIASDVRKKGLNWRQKLGYIFGPPGWKHDR